MSLNLSEQKKQMQIENLEEEEVEERGGFFAIFGCFAKKIPINSNVKSQLLGLTKSYISEDIDAFLLESIWQTLTSKGFTRFGNHW